MIDNACTSFSKKDAVAISSKAWTEGIVKKEENIVAGFESSGIWPLSFPKMQSRWRLYHDGGVSSKKTEIQPWITCRKVVRTEVLQLPAQVDRVRKRRKTLDVNNRLLTREQLNSYEN